MYGCESWTTQKAECQRTDAFELWCWRRFLRVPWTARRANQSILKKINWIFIGRTDVEAEAPILLATWCEESTHWKRPWCWERLRAGGEGGDREWAGWWHHWLNGHKLGQTPGDGEGQGNVLECMGSPRVRHDLATEQQQLQMDVKLFNLDYFSGGEQKETNT